MRAMFIPAGWQPMPSNSWKESYDTIVIVGPTTDATFQDISVYAEGVFHTPLGYIPIDEETAQAL